MVCSNSSRKRDNYDGSKNVLSKLIVRVQRRKSKAENFLVYALLQSTVERLKTDSCKLDTKKSLFLLKENESREFEDEQMSKLNACSVSEKNNSYLNTCQDDVDPLNLDDFFSRLKS